MKAMYKLANKINKCGGKRASRLLEKIYMAIYSTRISCQCEVGEGTEFMHSGMGTTIHSKTIIGKDCKIFQNTTLGSKWKNGICEDEAPVIGDNVIIGAGAVVLGNIKVGNNCIIGANAVVVTDIPENSIAVGIPAMVKGRKD